MTFDTWKKWSRRDFHLASLSPDIGSVAMFMVVSGFPAFFGSHGSDIDGESVDKNTKLSRDDRPMQPSEYLEENIDVSIRLEGGLLRYVCGPRFIVTMRNPASHARTGGSVACKR
jgi:hypothetical protein